MKTEIEKGQAGYLHIRKKQLRRIAVSGAGAAAILFVAGIGMTTMIRYFLAGAGILIFAAACTVFKQFVDVRAFGTVGETIYREIEEKGCLLTTAYDLVLKGKKKMPIQAIVISNHTVFGYAPGAGTKPEEISGCLKKLLVQAGLQPSTVKVFSEYVPFLSRVEGLNNIIQVNQAADQSLELQIRGEILRHSI